MQNAQEQFRADLGEVIMELRALLLEKNKKYGDAALNPKRIFAQSDAVELINVRIDDKLSRIANRQHNEDEDPELDLLGYLLLKRIALMRKSRMETEPCSMEDL